MRFNSLLPNNKARTIGRFLNLSILVLILTLCGLLIKRNYFDSYNIPTIAPGAKIAIKGVDLTTTEHTLLLAIQADCKYCTESARFYRRIVEGMAHRNDIRALALFSEGSLEGKEYLTG